MADQPRVDSPTVIRFYGYPKSMELDSPLELDEVALASEPVTLRRIAAFLQHAADLMERHGDSFGHEHYSDFVGQKASELTDVIVTRAASEKTS